MPLNPRRYSSFDNQYQWILLTVVAQARTESSWIYFGHLLWFANNQRVWSPFFPRVITTTSFQYFQMLLLWHPAYHSQIYFRFDLLRLHLQPSLLRHNRYQIHLFSYQVLLNYWGLRQILFDTSLQLFGKPLLTYMIDLAIFYWSFPLFLSL